MKLIFKALLILLFVPIQPLFSSTTPDVFSSTDLPVLSLKQNSRTYRRMQREWNRDLREFLVNYLKVSKRKYKALIGAKKQKEKYLKDLKKKKSLGESIIGKKTAALERAYQKRVKKILGTSVYSQYIEFRDQYRTILFGKLLRKTGKRYSVARIAE